MSEEKLYPDSHPIDAEPYYSRHVEAMTSEGLYSKAAIALQLAVRDKVIAQLEQSNSDRQAEIDRLLVAVAKLSVKMAGKKPDCDALAEKIYHSIDFSLEDGDEGYINCIKRALEAEL